MQNGAEHSADLYTLYNAYRGADHIVVQSTRTVYTVVEQNLAEPDKGPQAPEWQNPCRTVCRAVYNGHTQ